MANVAVRAGRSTAVAAVVLAVGCTAPMRPPDPGSPAPQPAPAAIASIPQSTRAPTRERASTTSRTAQASATILARESYLTAREQYRSGDRANARRNFRAAIDRGFAPRLFEDTPQQYLARMDREDAAAASQPTLSPFQQFFWNMGLRPVPPDEAAEGEDRKKTESGHPEYLDGR